MPEQPPQTHTGLESGPEQPIGPSPLDRRADILANIERARNAMFAEESGTPAAEPEPEPEPEEQKADDDAAAESDADASAGEQEAGPPEKGTPGDREDDDEEAEEGAEPAPDPDKAPVGEPEPVAPEKRYVDGDSKQTFVKTIVDGEEVEIPLSDLVASHQIRATADKKMQVATQLLEDTEALRRRLMTGEPGPQQGQQPAAGDDSRETPGQKPRSQLAGIDFESVIDKLQYGDKAEAAAAFQGMVEQIITQGADPQATRDELASQIESRVLAQAQWQSAMDRFRSEFPDIASDQIKGQIASNFFNAMWNDAVQKADQAGQPRPAFWPYCEAAGKATMQWLGANGASTDTTAQAKPNGKDDSSGQKPTVSIDEDRAGRKTAAVQPPEPRQPQARNVQDKPALSADQMADRSRRSAIHDMQKARGQV